MTKSDRLFAELEKSRAKLVAARDELETHVARVERLSVLEDSDLPEAQKTRDRFANLSEKLAGEVATLERDYADATYTERLAVARSAAEAEEANLKAFAVIWGKARRALKDAAEVTQQIDPALRERLRLGGGGEFVTPFISRGVLSSLGRIIEAFDAIPASIEYARNAGPIAEFAQVKAERE